MGQKMRITKRKLRVLISETLNEQDAAAVDKALSKISPEEMSKAELELLSMKIDDMLAQLGENKMRITRRQLRQIIREAAQGDIWAGVAAALEQGDSASAMNSVLNHFWMDDTWRMEEDALEDILIDLGRSPSPQEVKSASELWLKGYRAGEYRPQTKAEMEADWARGGKPRTDYNRK